MPSALEPRLRTAFLALAAGLLSATGTPSAALADAGHKHFAFGRPGKAKDVSRVVRLVAKDVKFDLRTLHFRVGETVKFIVVNKDDGDHELTIGDKAAQLAHRREMEKAAGRTLPITAFGAEHDAAEWPAYRDAGIERIVISMASDPSDTVLSLLDKLACHLTAVAD